MGASREAEVEEFAERVRGLKERSDRSYGALARRLGVSASTLHRYCSGEAVPAHFAPVERLARLCGAAPQEMLQLHRLWILADAVRRPQTPRKAAAPAGEETGPAPAAAPGPTPGSPEPDVTTAAVPVPRPDVRLRRVVLAAAAVAVAATGVAALAFAGPGAGSTDGRRPAAADSTDSTDKAGRADGSTDGRTGSPPSGSLSAPPGKSGPTASSTTPLPSEPGNATPATGAPRPTRKPSGTADAAPGVPFAWTADSEVWQSGCDHHYLIDRGPDRVPPPPVEQDAEPWARSLDAVHGGDTNVRVSLRGTSEKAVVLEALRVRVTERDSPVRRNVYGMSNGCGGALSPRHIDVNLDAPRPVARSVAGFDGVAGSPIPAVSFPYTVSASDPEVLLVNARTADCDCRWYLELEWSSGARSGTVRISDNGRPFRTSGTKGMPRYAYSATEHLWVTSR
ncbi:helix-turn-helix domain-containing protein [Streptomyces sp. NPDC055287]